MSEADIRKQIVDLLRARGAAALTPSDIAAALQLRGKQLKRLQKWLTELQRAGEVVRIHGNRFAIGAEADLATGRLSVSRSGDGFVTDAQTGREVFVPRSDTGTALPGDVVVVRLAAGGVPDEGHARASGKVIRIVERATREIVGTLRSTGRFLYVVPIEPGYRQDFYVADARGASLNDRVIIRFSGWANQHVNPEAEVVQVIGPADNPSLDTLAVMRHFDFPEAFPDVVLKEAESVSALMEHPGKREDWRDRFILTIDPARARDFDDALSLETDAAGNRVLGVHIADVCHFVRPGSPLDREAKTRGNSVYLPDKVIPMLPEQLSNGVCSLNPDVDRLAFSAVLTLDAHGRTIGRRFARTIIRSRRRLTYELAMDVIGGQPSGVGAEAVDLVRRLHHLAQQIRARRFAKFALELDVPECEIVMDADQRMTGVQVVANDPSHQLVEECMVLANEAVSTELNERGLPQIYRIHAPPNPDKLADLAIDLATMGFKPGDLTVRRTLAGFLKSVANHPLRDHVRVAVLRSMNRAEYSAVHGEHFGLAKRFYAHFTSPIRRYPDLAVHRQLAHLLAGPRRPAPAAPAAGGAEPRRSAKGPYPAEALQAIALHCSTTEQKADEAERMIVEIKKFRFLEEQLARGTPEVYDAVVSRVTNFGLFVDLPALQMQGLVHVSSISDRFVSFNRMCMRLEAGARHFGLGQKVRVYAARVDFDKRQADFALLEDGAVPVARPAGAPREGGVPERRRGRGPGPGHGFRHARGDGGARGRDRGRPGERRGRAR